MANTQQKIISIAGTTATGKSSLAVSLAKKINAEIISADSRQVYRGFDIATAKITEVEKCNIKHHLIDIINPDEDFSAGRFVNLAKSAINEILNKGKVPIITGGTGLYLKMLDGVDMPKGEPNFALRNELQAILDEKGANVLYERLVSLDSDFAKKIHVNDTYKVMRSIEILEQSKAKMSESRGVGKKEFDILKIVLTAKSRELVYERINKRVDIMIEQGLEAEARGFYVANPNLKTFHSTIGYQEFVPYFNNECTLKDVVEKIKQNTRRYAKRQLTWFRAQENINWFYIDEQPIEEIEKQIISLYNGV